MLRLNARHPAFDIYMEVLASLPYEPNDVLVWMLLDDFRPHLRNWEHVMRILRHLQRHEGASIMLPRDKNRCVVWIRKYHAARARRKATEYMAEVYGE